MLGHLGRADGGSNYGAAMTESTFTDATFNDSDGIDVFYRSWRIGQPRGTVVIAHGASEHSGRYGRFAAALNEAGFDSYAIDHRGHGRTADSTGKGIIGARGTDGVLDDLGLLIDIAHAGSSAPVVLFGHSMGSIFTQAFVERRSADLAGYVLSGCPGPLAEGFGELLEGVIAAAEGGMADEPLDVLGGFNDAFEPARTPYDWLSRDEAEVDAYIADPLCGDGVPLTYGYVASMLGASSEVMTPAGVASTPSNLPVLLVTGEQDPVGGMGVQVRELEGSLRAAGLAVTAHYYADARHELLNETNRDQVTADIVAWLRATMPSLD